MFSAALSLPRSRAEAAFSSFAQSELAMPSFVERCRVSAQRLASLARTVIVWVAEAVFPGGSVAVKGRMVTSGLAGDPAPPLVASDILTVTVPQLSLAVASLA